jgi:hypothetical protein
MYNTQNLNKDLNTDLICFYCNNLFTNKNILKSHQKTAKYCLVLQGKICIKEKKFECNICSKVLSSKKNFENHIIICKNKTNIFSCEYCDKILKTKQSLSNHEKICQTVKEEITFNCQYCDKILSTKQNLLSHEKNCDVKFLKEIQHLKKQNEILTKQNELLSNENEFLIKDNQKYSCQVKDLQETIERLCTKAIQKPTITNNTTNNILNIESSIDFNNVEDIKRIIDDDYDLNYAMNGQKGAARFLVDKFLKDENGNLKYICTDPSRHVFKFKNNKGEIKKDVEAKKLTNYIIDGGIRQKINEVLNDDVDKFELLSNPKTEIHNIKNDNNSFKRELASIIS